MRSPNSTPPGPVVRIQGWIVLAESPADVDEGHLDERVTEVEVYLKGWNSSSVRVELFDMNGLRQLTMSCHANRRRDYEVAGIDGLLELISRRLPGSWG